VVCPRQPISTLRYPRLLPTRYSHSLAENLSAWEQSRNRILPFLPSDGEARLQLLIADAGFNMPNVAEVADLNVILRGLMNGL